MKIWDKKVTALSFYCLFSGMRVQSRTLTGKLHSSESAIFWKNFVENFFVPYFMLNLNLHVSLLCKAIFNVKYKKFLIWKLFYANLYIFRPKTSMSTFSFPSFTWKNGVRTRKNGLLTYLQIWKVENSLWTLNSSIKAMETPPFPPIIRGKRRRKRSSIKCKGIKKILKAVNWDFFEKMCFWGKMEFWTECHYWFFQHFWHFVSFLLNSLKP